MRLAASASQINEYYGAEVREELRSEPWNFQFFQAVRLLERFGAGKPVGRFENPEEEAVRFSCNPALVFPPSQIHSLNWPDDEPAADVRQLHGPDRASSACCPSPTPSGSTTGSAPRTTPCGRFSTCSTTASSRSSTRPGKNIAFRSPSSATATTASPATCSPSSASAPTACATALSVPDEALVFYTGLLGTAAPFRDGSAPDSARLLRGAGGDRTVRRHLAPIPESDQSRPGDEREFSEQLSLGAIAGDEVWDQQCTARIVLGPLTLKQYLDFLPIGTAYQAALRPDRFLQPPRNRFRSAADSEAGRNARGSPRL